MQISMGETIHDIKEWYIPGPVDVRHETLMAMAEPPYGHRTKKLGDKIKSIRKNLCVGQEYSRV